MSYLKGGPTSTKSHALHVPSLLRKLTAIHSPHTRCQNLRR